MNAPVLTITTPTAAYPVLIGPGLLAELPAQLQALGLRGALWLISDSAVYPHYGGAVEGALREAGYKVQSDTVPSGEASKDLAVVAQLYDWMIGGGVERRDAVL